MLIQVLDPIVIPNTFTPNGDGNNERLQPIAVGMQRVDYFNVYNRWGQLVYSSGRTDKGWDGTLAGKQQGAGTFVWTVKAIDYTGKTYLQKGTVLLIR